MLVIGISRRTARSGALTVIPVWARVDGGGAVAVACADKSCAEATNNKAATDISIRSFILAPLESRTWADCSRQRNGRERKVVEGAAVAYHSTWQSNMGRRMDF